ncbi:MAG: hypothetical protein ABI458_04195 [Chloroflexota bacterium]
MDEIALRYLLLGLRLGRHLPGLVDSYHGPAELSEAVDGEPLTPAAELHDEAMQLAGIAAELPADTAARRRRVTWLVAQVGAMGALARWVGGEEIGYVDLVEDLYDIELQLEPDATFDTARRMLDSALPGSAPLRERLADHDARGRVPPERAIALASELSARLRTRTRAQLWLPERESLRIEAAHDVGWTIEAHYLGAGSSVVRVNIDRPLTFAALAEIVAHEGYPGHHAEASVKDDLLVSAGHEELSLTATLAPQALVSEGMAEVGREVVMSDEELGSELQRLARSVDRTLDLASELMVLRARRLLSPALGNAAVALHRDGEPVDEVRSYLAEVGLVSDERLEETISRLRDPVLRTQPFAHIEGRRLVSEWLEVHGQTHGFSRLLAEQQTPHALRSELNPI